MEVTAGQEQCQPNFIVANHFQTIFPFRFRDNLHRFFLDDQVIYAPPSLDGPDIVMAVLLNNEHQLRFGGC